MNSKVKIIVIGIGGVGGYLGGMLASYYEKSAVKIVFITRRTNEIALKKNGLKLQIQGIEQVCHPSLVTSSPEEAGIADFIICCVKNYDLESTFQPLAPCITSSTCILPIQNGIDNSEKIRRLYPYAKIWNGCIYLVSRLVQPDVVVQNGNLNQLWFGSSVDEKEQLFFFESLLKKAAIKADVSDNITIRLWEKFFFISALATATSYFNSSIGDILSSYEKKQFLIGLMLELKSIARKIEVKLPGDIVQQSLRKLQEMPYESTSSMHDDFIKGKKTELASLTGKVVELGKKQNIFIPFYEKAFAHLIKS